MSTVTWPASSSRGTITPERVADVDLARSVRPRARTNTEAARAVAALLDLAAVGVEDARAKFTSALEAGSTTSTWSQADAEAAVGKRADLRGVERERRARGIDDDEVVAEACILVKGARSLGHDPPCCALRDPRLRATRALRARFALRAALRLMPAVARYRAAAAEW